MRIGWRDSISRSRKASPRVGDRDGGSPLVFSRRSAWLLPHTPVELVIASRRSQRPLSPVSPRERIEPPPRASELIARWALTPFTGRFLTFGEPASQP